MRWGWWVFVERMAGSPKVEAAHDVSNEIGLAGPGIGSGPIVYFVLANLSSWFLVKGLQNSHCDFSAFFVTGDQVLLALS